MKKILLMSGEKSPYGDELVTNGGFDTDSDWTKGTDWTISGGVATHASAGGKLTQQISGTFEIGKSYLLTFDIVSVDANWIKMNSYGAFGTGDAHDTVGSQSEVLVATGTSAHFEFYSNATNMVIDNVSIKEVL